MVRIIAWRSSGAICAAAATSDALGPGAAPATVSPGDAASQFLRTTAPEDFYAGTIAMPGGDKPPIPRAEPKKSDR